MRENNSSARLGPPPPVMTWKKAAPIMALALIFDALRFMCNQLWFFGPALLAIICAYSVGDTLSSWTLGLLGTKTASVACSVGAVAIGMYGLPAMAALGVVLAIAVGLFGWLSIGLCIVVTNRRLFSENAASIAWFAGSLFISEVPFVGSLPAFSGTLWRLYHVQIKKEAAALRAYEAQREQLYQEERARRAELILQSYAAQKAANEAQYASEVGQATALQEERDAANDESYNGIHEPVRKTA